MSFQRLIALKSIFRPVLLFASLLCLPFLGPPPLSASEVGGEGSAETVRAVNPPPISESPSEAATSEVRPVQGVFDQPTAAEMAVARQALLNSRLDLARSLRLKNMAPQAETIFVELLADENPEAMQQTALLELAQCAQDRGDLPRALQIYSQFLNRWPHDARMPEILLHQGQFFRELGLNTMALGKFYGVMTAALALKSDKLEYYKRIVMQAQNEIAETHFKMGKYADAAEYFQRLLKQNNPLLDRSLAQYRLLSALSLMGHNEEAMGQASDFLTRFPQATERPEVRFIIAQSLKKLGRDNEAIQQVLALLQEQKQQTTNHPEVWTYWQQRAGNEIGNQLYREGDFTKALDVYLSLAELDRTPAWQIPVQYQVGLTYEKLQQPQMASQIYSNILSREVLVGTNASPGLKSVVQMARWRIRFIDWQARAENAAKEITALPHAPVAAKAPES